jgi:hypothetical protein
MAMFVRRAALALATFAAGGGVALLPTGPTAYADVPDPVTVTDSAARHFGDGGPAAGALVDSTAVAAAPDGAVIFWDRTARAIRRIDPVTGVVTRIAGTGAVPPSNARCSLNATTPALELPLFEIGGLWTDAAGGVYMWSGYSQNCAQYGSVYRLDPNDQRWHLAVSNPGGGNPWGAYHSVAVDPAGDVFVGDGQHAVIRKFAAGTSPTSGGVIVAGTLDASGVTGDGGAATAAHIYGPDFVAASSDGSLVFSSWSGSVIRRVDAATGVITTVAGTGVQVPSGQPAADEGQAATQTRLAVDGLSVTPDGQRVFFESESLGIGANRTFVLGGPVHTVVGPYSVSSDGDVGRRPSPYAVPDPAHPTQLLVSTWGYLRDWPVDGSKAGEAGSIVGGLPSPNGGPESADGTPLSDAFFPLGNAIAQAPDGSFALAGSWSIRRLSGLASSDTLSTVSSKGAVQLAYDGDGALYALYGNLFSGQPYQVRKIVNGTESVVIGAGSAQLVDGASGADVALPPSTKSIAIDRTTHTLYVLTETQLWSLHLGTGVVHRVAGTGSSGEVVDVADARDAPIFGLRDVAVDQGTHAVVVDAGGAPLSLYRVDSDGSLHVLGGSAEADAGHMEIAGDGTIYVGNGPLMSFGPDGATGIQTPAIATAAFTLTDAGRVVAFTRDSGAGGLLALSDPLSAPEYPSAMPTVSAQPGPASVTLTVVPPASTGQTVTLRALQQGSSVRYPVGGAAVGSFVTDGTNTAHEFSVYRLASPGHAGPGLLVGQTYRFDAIISDRGDDGRTITSHPATVTAMPTVDAVAPSPPSITTQQAGSSVSVKMTMPMEPDLARVVVRRTQGSVPPATSTDGEDMGSYEVGAYPQGQPIDLSFWASQMTEYAFSAFSVDTSGNVSDAATALKPEATLTSGSPGDYVGWVSQSGHVDLVWSGGVSVLRYAAGTTAPAKPNGGQQGDMYSSAWGYYSPIPVATGAKVAVSMFDYSEDGASYSRRSFVLTGGMPGSDVLTVAVPDKVAYGSAPAVTASLQRHSPDGVHPMVNQAVYLYQRLADSSAWKYVAGGYTTAAGTYAFTVSAPTANVDYQVRYSDIDQVPLSDELTLEAVDHLGVQPAVSAKLSASSVRVNKSVTMSGAVSSHRSTSLRLQRKVSGSWKTLTTFSSGATGGYKISYVPKTRASYTLRVLAPASKSLLSALSPTRTLTAS